jgi:hypothetical protein
MSTQTTPTIEVTPYARPEPAALRTDERSGQRDGRHWVAWTAVAVIALAAVALALVGTRTSPGVSSDSVDYISGARNVAHGNGFVDYASKPITLFPPGFPATLAAGDKLGVDPVDGARWLNALAFGALVVLTFVLARRHVRIWLAVGASAAVAFAPGSFGVFTFVWSEPVFCVLALAMILALEPLMVRRGRDPKLIVLVGVLGAAAFLYRYAGVALVVLPVLVIAVAARRDGIAAVLRRVAGYSAIAVIAPALVVARNLSHGADPLGPRASSLETPPSIARDMADAWRNWLVDSRAPSALGYLLLAGVLALLVAGLWIGLRERPRASHTTEYARETTMFPVAVFVAGYLAYVVLSELLTNIDVLDIRLIAPVLAPTVVILAIAIERILHVDWTGAGKWVPRVLTAALVLWLVASFATSLDRARSDGDAGQGFAAASWKRSQLVAAVNKLPLARQDVVFSNVANGVYFAGGRQPIVPSPSWHPYRSDDLTNELPGFRQQVEQARSAFLAWQPASRGGYVSPAELRQHGFELEAVARTSDGTIYRVRALEGAAT